MLVAIACFAWSGALPGRSGRVTGTSGRAVADLFHKHASDLRRCTRVTLVKAEGALDTWRSKSARPLFTHITVLLS